MKDFEGSCDEKFTTKFKLIENLFMIRKFNQEVALCLSTSAFNRKEI